MSRPTSGGLAFPKRPTVSPLATGAYALFVRRYINNEIFRNGNAPVPTGDPYPRIPHLYERLSLLDPARGSLADYLPPASFYTPGPASCKRGRRPGWPDSPAGCADWPYSQPSCSPWECWRS